MPGVRISVRRLMLVVAIAALICGGLAWWRRVSRLGEDHASFVPFCVMMERTYRGETGPGDVERFRYWSAMREKYERAAESPWWPMPPDLPAPR